MVKHKKIRRIFSFVTMLILFYSLIILPFFNKPQGTVFAETVSNNLYAFVTKQSSSENATKFYVDFGITLDYNIDGQAEGEVNVDDAKQMKAQEKAPFQYATVYLRTRNLSAIAEAGDYEAVDEQFIVYGTDPYATLSIKTNRGGLQLNNSTTQTEGALRDFIVEIYKVEIVGITSNAVESYNFLPVNTTSNISSEKISIAPEYTMSTEKNPENIYANESRFDLQYIMDATTGFDENLEYTNLEEITETDKYPGDTLTIDLTNDRGNNFYEPIKYLSEHNMMKLGIQVYGEAREHAAGYVNNCYVGLQVFSGDANKVGAPNLEDVQKEHIYTHPSVKEIARWYIKFQSDRYEDMGLSNAFNGSFEGVTVGTYFDEGIFISGNIPDGRYGHGGKYDNFTSYTSSNIFIIDDLAGVLDGGSLMSARAWTYYNGTTKTSIWTFRYMMMNYRAEVSDATFGNVYYDEDGNAKLGLSLRFSEPMQLAQYSDGKVIAPSIDAYINNRMIDENKLNFQYVSGEGTDTFYFEAALPDVKISSIRIGNPYGFEDVYDYASNYQWYSEPFQNMNIMEKGSNKKVNGWDKISELAIDCSYDLRKPALAIEAGRSVDVKKAHSVTVRTENISETGRLYYGWSEIEGQLPEQISVVPILASGSQTIPSPSGISGTRYLYAVAVSDLEKRSDNEELLSNVPFYFDNEAPSLGEMVVDNAYKEKKFTIPIINNSIIGFNNYANLKNSVKVVVSKDKDGKDVVLDKTVRFVSGAATELEVEEITFNFSLSAAEIGLTNESNLQFGTYYISFAFSDVLENRLVVAPTAYYFDIRDIFQVELEKGVGDPDFEMDEFAMNSENALFNALKAEDYYTLDLSKKEIAEQNGGTFYFTFKAINSNASDSGADTDLDTAKAVTSIGIEEFVSLSSGEDKKSKFRQTTSDGEIRMTVEDKFEPGLYRLILKDLAENSLRKTLPIYFYVTNGKVSDTAGKVGTYQDVAYALKNVAMTNKVFQIPNSIPYSYLTDGGALKTESYSGSNKPACFSSKEAALSYIRYKEYLDLYAIILDDTDADNLNKGFMRKAQRVTQTAEAGQVWIRYKEENWRPNTTTTNWVYYYYGADQSSLPININALSNELQIALSTVSSYIRSKVEMVNLVTEDFLDQYGAPKLSPEQIPAAASSLTSNGGTVFANALDYAADEGMYYSIRDNLPLVTNALVKSNANSRLYYKSASTTRYQPLVGGETFGECIQSTGKITILELSDKGVFEYYVFVDNEEPILNFSIATSEGEQDKFCSMKDNGTTIRGGNVYIKGLTDDDTLSFVAIYKYTGQNEGELLNVYRKQDFDNGQGLPLEDGKYHVQVSDRSGNSYTFVLFVRSDKLVATVTPIGSSYIRFAINREQEEILSYKVFLDSSTIPITTDFAVNRFTESGIYKFEILDKYGNEKIFEYPFNRMLPTVGWRYKTEENTYLVYDPENAQASKKLTVEKINDQSYKLFTSTYLHFLPLEGCLYEIISGTPNPSESITSDWVTLNQIASFTMKVYYEADPDVYVIYTCIVDNTAPSINVSYEKSVYEAAELAEIQQKFENGDFTAEKNNFAPSFIGFTHNSATTFYVLNGERVQNRYFKVQVSDDYGVSDVKIYLNDEWINPENTNVSYTYLSRRGTYKIVATDDFGNVSTFTFTNEYSEDVEYFVDEEKIPTDVAFEDYFDGTEYTKVEYGNSAMTIRLLSSAEIHYIITDDNGNKKHFAFVVKDGVMYNFHYVIEIVEGEYGDLEIENISLHGNEALKTGVVAEIKELGVAIYLSKNNDGAFTLAISSTNSEKKAYTVEARISLLENKNAMPYYFKTKISTIPSTIEFVDGDGNLIANAQTIKVNKSFEIRKDTIAADIVSVEVAFSTTGKYTTYETVYDGTYHQMIFENEGMYHVKVVNRYGVQTDYYVVISSQFTMSATVEYIDGTSIEYSMNYTKEQDDFYSNKSVEFIVYSTNPEVTYTGKLISVTYAQGYTLIYVNNPGEYHLTIKDEYGNRLEKNIFINATAFSIDENILTNFNEKALRRDENYTNQKVLINKNEVYKSEIAFIGMRYGDSMITIYDNVSEKITAFDENQSIGGLGDGEYTLIFRDRYGNKAERVIHYCGTSTLTILRNTLNGVGSEVYPIEEMLKNGVWTNDSVNFLISATEYRLTVDGMENVTSIRYDTKTKNEYEVYYLDEYGFEYEFKVYLHREDIVITPVASMSVAQLSDLLVTTDSVQIDFTENAKCSYILNNEPEKVYKAGDILYKDGVYHFKVIDKAGNVSTYTVKKDSAVEYRLEGSGVSEVLVNGSVTNSHSVKFFAENADNAYIKKVFHNNEFIEYNDEIFTERGKWELIVADDVGNESYFRFYILYGKIDGFSYNTPYNYVITSVIWEMENSIAAATETIKESGLRLEATENGKYTVTMQSTVTSDVKSFTFTIDKTPPKVQLVGCEQNEKTINNITLQGCSVGDTVYVYKDGVRVKTVRIDSDYMDPPTINEAGKYRIVVENEAGVQTELSFERKYIPNVAGSVLIIVLALAAVAGLFVGLVWRNHSKTDD